MISSVLEYDGGSFLTGNHFTLLDPEDDFPLRVHHMAVYYNHTITEVIERPENEIAQQSGGNEKY